MDSVHIWSGWYFEPDLLWDDEDHDDDGECVGDDSDEYDGGNVVVVVADENDAAYV